MTDRLYEIYKPTKNNKASICHWELEFEFITKEQCQKFINLYMELEIPVSFSYTTSMGDSGTSDRHIILVENGIWANNLKILAEILDKVDYNANWDTD